MINLNGNKFEFEGNDILFRVEDGGCLTINGEAEGNEIKSADYIGSVNEGGVLVVNGGDYEAATTCFQSNGGELYITAGKFNAFEDTYFGKYTINFIDSMKTVGKVEISGGTFVNFNPAASISESPEYNYLAENKAVEVMYNGQNISLNKPEAQYGNANLTYAQQPYSSGFASLNLTIEYTVK